MREIIGCLKELGYSTVDSGFYEVMGEWLEWYRGKVDSFHCYKVYNGVEKIRQNRRSLGMARKVCMDKADLLLNEKVTFNFGNEEAERVVLEVLDRNNFWVAANQLVEVSNALGTGAFVEYISDGEIFIDTVSANCIFPISWHNGAIVECAFASYIMVGGEKLLYLNLHLLEEGKYVILNKVFEREKNGELVEINNLEGVCERFETHSAVPLFQIIKPNVCNNLDLGNPMGISVFGNSIDILKSVDLVYDSMINEFILGKKRIFVRDNLLKYKPSNGKIEPMFDTNDVVFNWWGDDSDGNSEIKEIDLSLRIEEHRVGLAENLSLLAAACGFGHGYYSFVHGAVKTATEVISENSQLFRNIRKDEMLLEKALIDLAKGILVLANKLGDKFLDGGEIRVNFDDSIIEDSGEVKRLAMAEREAGIIDDVEYFTKVYKMPEEKALELVNKILKRRNE